MEDATLTGAQRTGVAVCPQPGCNGALTHPVGHTGVGIRIRNGIATRLAQDENADDLEGHPLVCKVCDTLYNAFNGVAGP